MKMWLLVCLFVAVVLIWLLVPSVELFVQDRYTSWLDFFSDRAYEVPARLAEDPTLPQEFYGSVRKDGPDRMLSNCYWRDGKLQCS